MDKIDMILEIIDDEIDRPVKDLFGAAIMLCLALGLPNKGCDNCPVVIYNYETRTEAEKCNQHEPCQINLYRWMLDRAKEEMKENE